MCDDGGETFSRFGGLWVDRRDGTSLLEERQRRGLVSDELANEIGRFMRDGFVVLEGAVEGGEVAALRAELDAFWVDPPADALVETYEVPEFYGTQQVVPARSEYRRGATVLLDYYAFSPRMRRAIANPRTVAFLTAVLDATPKAFQGLTFWRGSESPIHKDTGYVQIKSNPTHIVATWLALEDVNTGSGELQFHVGSHRDPEYLFGGASKWLEAAPEELPTFLQSFVDDAERNAHRRESFIGKAGDLLIWHSDLAHGGAKISNPGATRQSQVTHFTTALAEPAYAEDGKLAAPAIEDHRCLFMSQHSPFRF